MWRLAGQVRVQPEIDFYPDFMVKYIGYADKDY